MGEISAILSSYVPWVNCGDEQLLFFRHLKP